MAFYGLWQNENDIDLSLAEIQTKTEIRKALVVKLKFRKIVLQQQFAESSAFNTFPLFYAFYAYPFPPHLRFLRIPLSSSPTHSTHFVT